MRHTLVLAAGAAALAAAPLTSQAPEPGPAPGRADPVQPRPAANRITLEEIQGATVSNSHELTRRLRPRWLAGQRGPTTLGGGTVTEVALYDGESRIGGPGQPGTCRRSSWPSCAITGPPKRRCTARG